MPWDGSPSGGFTTGAAWIQAHPMAETINAAAQVDDPGSVFAHFQRLIALRHDEPVVAHGTFRMLLPDDERVYAFVREYEGDRLLVVANLSDTPDVVADLGEATYDGADLLVGSVLGSDPTPTDPLGPWESRVFRLR
jgi:oligo-1,6-glucosidase